MSLWNSHDILGDLIGPVAALGRTNSDRYVMLDHFVYCVRKRLPALTTGGGYSDVGYCPLLLLIPIKNVSGFAQKR